MPSQGVIKWEHPIWGPAPKTPGKQPIFPWKAKAGQHAVAGEMQYYIEAFYPDTQGIYIVQFMLIGFSSTMLIIL